MTAVDQMLRSAAAQMDWPPTPDLAAAVAARIQDAEPIEDAARSEDVAQRGPLPEGIRRPPLERGALRIRPRPDRRRLRIRRPLLIALAALLLLAGSALAIPAVRDWLGLSTVEIKRVPKPLPAGRGAKLALGTHVTLDSARAKLGFRPILPSGLGTPTVYYDGFPPGGQLGLVYPHGVVVTELEGELGRYITKFVPPGTRLDRLTIAGDRALWIHGALHQYAYADRTGAIRTDSVRTAGDVLLWRHRNLLIRVEGARSKAQAVAIARSAREAP